MEQNISELMGSTISIPDDLELVILQNRVYCDLTNAEFKLLTYIDSAGCTTCKMKLRQWDDLINRYNAATLGNVNFLMVINTPAFEEYMDAIYANHFAHPVCFDPSGSFEKVNNLPSDEIFHTLLLDKDNKVIAIGDPIRNPKVRDLYDKFLLQTSQPKLNKWLYTSHPVRSLGVVNAGETIKETFILLNKSDTLINLDHIITSNNDIEWTLSNKEVLPNKRIRLEIAFKPSLSHSKFCEYIDLTDQELNTYMRFLIYGFINNNCNAPHEELCIDEDG